MLNALLPSTATGRIYYCNHNDAGNRDRYQSISWQTLLNNAPTVSAPALFWPAHNTLASITALVSALQSGALAVPYNPKFSSQQIAAIRQKNNFDAAFPSGLSTAIFTSGSTAAPKLVAHTLANHLANASKAQTINATTPTSRWHMSLPMFHIGGLAVFFRSLLAGCDLVLGGRVDDAEFLRQQKITHASCVATQLQRLAEQNLDNLALQCLLVGGGPVPKHLLSLPLPLRYTYGMSELSSQACTERSDGTMQWLCKHRFNEQGELLVSGDTLFQGYLDDNLLQTQGTEFATKDVGVYHDTWLQIHGRVDNQFISGGENIQPEAIEACLLTHPNIIEAVVVGVDDATYGKRPFAFVRLRNASNSDAAQHSIDQSKIDQHSQAYLPSYMRPIGYAQLNYSQLKPSRAALTAEANAKVNL